MRNILISIQNKIPDFFKIIRSNKFTFQISRIFRQEKLDEKFSFAPISFKLGCAHVSEDSKIIIKNL